MFLFYDIGILRSTMFSFTNVLEIEETHLSLETYVEAKGSLEIMIPRYHEHMVMI